MISKFIALTLAVWLADAGLPRLAKAQSLDQLGNRASALGAFVAVADDASAVAWNPAGLVNGPIFNILLDFGRMTTEPEADVRTSTQQAGQSGGTFLAAGVPPLGISYYRMRKTELNPAAEAGPGREDNQLLVRSLVTSHLGVTVLQSLADGLTVGATVKLVRGSLATGTVQAESWEAGFEQAESLDGPGETKADVDAGALLAMGRFRAGIVARNLARPTFDARGVRRRSDGRTSRPRRSGVGERVAGDLETDRGARCGSDHGSGTSPAIAATSPRARSAGSAATSSRCAAACGQARWMGPGRSRAAVDRSRFGRERMWMSTRHWAAITTARGVCPRA